MAGTQADKRDRITVLQNRILQKLRTPSTIDEIADAIGLGYHSARRYIQILEEMELVEDTGTRRNRKVVYIRSDSTMPEENKNYIPIIKNAISNQEHKASTLLPGVGNEDDMASVAAAKNVPGNVAELLYLATLAANGMDISMQLSELRTRMQRDYITLNNAMQVIRQMLETPNWWDPKRLKQMTQDHEYNFYSVKTAYTTVAERLGKDIVI